MHLSDGARFPSFAIAALSAGVPTLARATEINRELLEGAAALFANDREVGDTLGRGVDQRSAALDHGRGRTLAGDRFRAGHGGAGLPLAVSRGRARLDGVTRTITISIEQLNRPQPGRHRDLRARSRGGTSRARRSVDSTSSDSRARGAVDEATLPLRRVNAPCGVRLLTTLWPLWPLGVPKDSDVVHATSMAGPYGGGIEGRGALGRDARPAVARRTRDLDARRYSLPRPPTPTDRRSQGPARDRHVAGSGRTTGRRRHRRVADPLRATRRRRRHRRTRRRVVGSRTARRARRAPVPSRCTPARANRARTSNVSLEAHTIAYADESRPRPTGPRWPEWVGWRRDGRRRRARARCRATCSSVSTATPRSSPTCRAPKGGVCRRSRRCTPARASSRARRRRASRTMTVSSRVDPLDVASIAEGLLAALHEGVDEDSRAARRTSVADLTWRNVALDHLAAWQ